MIFDQKPVPEPTVVYKPARVATRLAELGIDQDILRRAVQYGGTQAARTTGLHPPAYGGSVAWAETVYHLRLESTSLGWRSSDKECFSTVIHPSATLQIAVSSGNSSTGIPEQTPATRTPKGPVTKAAIQENQLHFSQIDPEFPKTHLETWYLLFFEDRRRNEIRLELSLPKGYLEDGRIVQWFDRIVLPAIPLAQTPSVGTTKETYVAEVKRKKKAG